MGGNAAAVKEMAAQLAAELQVQGEKGREAWSQLNEDLAEVAAMACDDPKTALQAMLKLAKNASFSEDLEKRVSNFNPGLLKELVRLVADELQLLKGPVHMVDEHGNFCEANVESIIKWSGELSAGKAPYAVISIVGAQSTGKSYLLNRLFGTNFPEMDAKSGWKQTTRGIMMSRYTDPSLILLDVEGFDGREKGKDTSFENQAALFALTVSDLMIVNMNIVDIGREVGGGSLLFRTIFQERAKIEGAGLTKILVVLRQYNGETPLKMLRSDVLKRLHKTWESVNEKSMKLERYIEVDTFGMPDKESPKFPKEVTVLRRILLKSRRAKVPSSIFTASSKMIWEKVKQNKQLDIPSLQALIGNILCRQLAEEALNSSDPVKNHSLLKGIESPRSFKKESNALLVRITTWYDLETKNYDRGITIKDRQYMVEKLNKIFAEYAKKIVLKIKEETLDKFKYEFDTNIKKYKALEDYGKLKLKQYLEKFMKSCEDLKVFDSVYIKYINGKLKEDIESHTALSIAHIEAERNAELERKAEEWRNRPLLVKLFCGLLGLCVPMD